MISLNPQAFLLTNEVLATWRYWNSDSDEVSMDVTGSEYIHDLPSTLHALALFGSNLFEQVAMTPSLVTVSVDRLAITLP